MKILYKQPKESQNSALSSFDIQNCYFKKITVDQDTKNITKKTHHHTSFELHIVTEGFQEYNVSGTTYRLESGSFLLIYPDAPHTITASMPLTRKFSITFNKQTDISLPCLFGKADERIFSNLEFISNEALLKRVISHTLTENSILEILVWIFRLSGAKEKEQRHKQDENISVSLAKQYIEDNIEFNPDVKDVAAYCYFSTKQLTRIFQKYEGIAPGEYIIKRRIEVIEEFLRDDTYSLKKISEIMSFNNEYYFNTFFKKYSGMPPGEYRRMFGK